MVLEYFREDIPSVKSCCTNLGGVSCDKCERKGKLKVMSAGVQNAGVSKYQ